jgi:hypothetical protein
LALSVEISTCLSEAPCLIFKLDRHGSGDGLLVSGDYWSS